MDQRRNKALILGIGVLFMAASCQPADPNKNIDEGNIAGNVYTNEEIGWTIEIPEGWTIVDREKTEALNEKGQEAFEKTLDAEIDASKLKNLISFEKNRFNIFQSASEPFEPEYEGEWEENNSSLKEITYATYVNAGIRVDSSVTTTETVDGLTFQTYSFTIYGPDGEMILEQLIYARLINGNDFGVNLNYNNYVDRDEMLKVFRNSKFRKD